MAGSGGSDGELFRAARQGDAGAWEALVDRLGPRAVAVARAFRLSFADAQDVYQITWYRLVTHMDSIREPDRVGAWLAATARNESLRVLKRNGRQVPTGDDEEFEGADPLAPPPEARLLASERQRAVWDAVAELPSHCQRLLRMFMADPPPSYDEITAALDMPLGSIGPTRRRCLDKLRTLLGGINGDGEGSASQEDPQ
ncbi:MAG: RNA polymerase sigma factor [Acidimicrobiales bacterium]